ncbi:MAG TPA: RNA polymerase sigma factor [Burkholderiales bacterium]|nr:RNA polymerase sigma factor [Burkholderiales bacterium]
MKQALSQGHPSESSDADLAQRIAHGDSAAFEVIMRRHNRALFRTARAILRDDAEAEDALQEAYIKAYRMMAEFRGESRLSTWLGRIVANEALMRLRKSVRRSGIIPFQSSATTEEVNQISDTAMHQGPEISAQRAEMRKLIEAKIDALPDAYRPVFMLRAVEEFSVEETADILHIPAATVRSRFFRARSLLREALAKEVDFACEDAFAFAGSRCDRIVANVLERIGRGEGAR